MSAFGKPDLPLWVESSGFKIDANVQKRTFDPAQNISLLVSLVMKISNYCNSSDDCSAILAMSANSKPDRAARKFLTRNDYVDHRSPRGARFFLGKYLCVEAQDGYAEGIITETE